MHHVTKPRRCTASPNRGDAPRDQTAEIHRVSKHARKETQTRGDAPRQQTAEMHRENQPRRCTAPPHRGDAPRDQTAEIHRANKPRRCTASTNRGDALRKKKKKSRCPASPRRRDAPREETAARHRENTPRRCGLLEEFRPPDFQTTRDAPPIPPQRRNRATDPRERTRRCTTSPIREGAPRKQTAARHSETTPRSCSASTNR